MAKQRQTPRPSRVSEPITVNLYDARTRLSELVDRAADGEEILIALPISLDHVERASSLDLTASRRRSTPR